jgi:hypothetical protein
MKPSRIVKSAHARAGTTLTVKAFARHVINGTQPASARLILACEVWLTGKEAAANAFKPVNGPGPTAKEIAETKFKREREKQAANVQKWVVAAAHEIERRQGKAVQ